MADEVVAYKHGDMVVPHGVDGGTASARHGVVYHVVVNKRRIVYKFYGGCRGEHALVDWAEKLGAHY